MNSTGWLIVKETGARQLRWHVIELNHSVDSLNQSVNNPQINTKWLAVRVVVTWLQADTRSGVNWLATEMFIDCFFFTVAILFQNNFWCFFFV